jgi:2-methylcitrate dehydratase PrpD
MVLTNEQHKKGGILMSRKREADAKDTIYTFISYILKTDYENLSGDDVLWAKKALIDFIGVCAVGAKEHYCEAVVDQIRKWGGTPECTILFYGDKTNAPLAALANGILARAADLDDVYEEGFLQSYAHIISPLLVAAELKGGCTGKEFMTAFTIGTDMNCRMAVTNEEPCTVSGRYNLFRIFGAVAAVSKLLNYNEQELHNALGIAYGMAHGELQGLRDGAFSCLLSSGGFNAQNVLMACLLAKRGIPGTKNILDGYYGFYHSFEHCANQDVLLSNLGEEFYGKRASIKNYPSSRATHAGIDAALYLASEHNIDPREIKKIDIKMFDFCYGIVGSPIEEKRHPKNSEQAKFSYPFCVACALSRKSVFPEILDDAVVKDTLIAELTERTDTSVDKGLTKFQAALTVTMNNGDVFSQKVTRCLGHPENPMSFDGIVDKFTKCINHYSESAVKNVSKVVDYVSNLEKTNEVNLIPEMINSEFKKMSCQ